MTDDARVREIESLVNDNYWVWKGTLLNDHLKFLLTRLAAESEELRELRDRVAPLEDMDAQDVIDQSNQRGQRVIKLEREVLAERDARLNAEAEAQLLYDRIVTAYDELRYVDINDSHFQQGFAYLGAGRPTLAETRAERERGDPAEHSA